MGDKKDCKKVIKTVGVCTNLVIMDQSDEWLWPYRYQISKAMPVLLVLQLLVQEKAPTEAMEEMTYASEKIEEANICVILMVSIYHYVGIHVDAGIQSPLLLSVSFSTYTSKTIHVLFS